MGSGNEDLIADFIFQTSAPYEVARNALKNSKWNLTNALLHFRNSSQKVRLPIVAIIARYSTLLVFTDLLITKSSSS